MQLNYRYVVLVLWLLSFSSWAEGDFAAQLKEAGIAEEKVKLLLDQDITDCEVVNELENSDLKDIGLSLGLVIKVKKLCTLPQRKPGQVFQDQLKNGGLGPKMVVIPKGSFKMGSDEGSDDEKPMHTVTIGYEYAMSQYEITFDDYDRFCEATGRAKPGDQGWGRGQRPVITVSWEEMKVYTQWLTEQTGNPYRLPTEAEWEYAARAGTTTSYSFGDDVNQLGNYAWYDGNSGNQTHPVGEKRANGFGLYDMHGNVWEWVEDIWYTNYEGAPTDGSAWLTGGDGSYRLLRGGSWSRDPTNCRSAGRYGDTPGVRYNDLGGRIVLGVLWTP